MTTALFVGRFQPFHLGHLQAIRDILLENEKIIIAIGSSQEQNTHRNPFSAGERKKMITSSLDDAGINKSKYEIVSVPDTGIDTTWAAQMTSRLDFDVFYTAENKHSEACFQNAGYPTKRLALNPPYSATLVRKKILEEEDWSHLVPAPVFKFIKQIEGEHRIRSLL